MRKGRKRPRALLEAAAIFPLNNDVLEVAEGIRPRVRTLDALHLATALLTRVQPVIATHDARMAAVAVELGLEVVDPV